MRITDTSKQDPVINLFEATSPGGIERQEKRGQRELSESSQLPRISKYKYQGMTAKDFYEYIGFKVPKQLYSDDLFMDVVMPEGWAIVPTDHSMWSDLVDPKGRKRASIFYKSAFYDRDASINPLCRYNVEIGRRMIVVDEDYSMDENGEYNADKTPLIGVVKDHDGTIVFSSKEYELRKEYKIPGDRYSGAIPGYWQKKEDIKTSIKDGIDAWMNENYPDYKNPVKYWR